ncbi:serine/threonine-protein kinase PknD [Mycobacterium sp.]|uniref:serine/threonine-protein kinase PknD n=1 Tax=Mycobacterium sp. TaxID=1785 RepID=UPI0031DB7084
MTGNFPDSRVGRQFGPYRLMHLIGRGGMGEVYAAEDTRKRRVVALKLISQEFSKNPVFRMRMQREADAAGRLTEPHVVPIHDYGDHDGQFYVDMRLIDGISLRDVLNRDGQLSPARTVAIVQQIAAALDAAHTIGITHRDVKPANILITSSDFAYLVDFGIARAASDPGLTQTGMTIGTYYYMAPERFTGDECTPSSDVYALACVLSECLTGAPPFRADTIERMIGAHLMEAPPRPSQLRPGIVPSALDRVIAKGMAKNPADRYATAGALASDAHDALTTSDQHDATTILRHGKQASLSTGYAGTGIAPQANYGSTTAHTEARRASPAPSHRAENPSYPAYVPDFTPTDKAKSNGKLKKWIVIGVAATVLAAAAGVTAYLVSRPSASDSSTASGQRVLPFDGLDFRLSPSGVAVDGTGNVYITSESMYGRVLELVPGSTKPSVLPFNGLYQPQALAVDKSGAVYVTDFNNRVVKLDAGAQQQTVLPFNGLNYPEGVAVDAQGNVFVADRGNSRVVELPAGSDHQTVLPFNGLRDPDGVAVDSAGNVYVSDTSNNRLLKLADGAQTVLPFTNLSVPWGVAVDDSGNVYATEHNTNKVAKLAAGASDSTVLPFTGLNTPLAVAVGSGGNVYVADRGNDRVVALAD